MKKPILIYLDDFEGNLIGIEGQFSDQFEIHTFLNPQRALDAVLKLKPQMILSDEKMPKMSGVAFLQKTIPLRPQAIRLLITAYASEGLAIKAIKSGEIHDFIRKPCTNEDLEVRLKAAVKLFEENSKNYTDADELKSKNEETKNLIEEVKKKF